MAALMGIGLVLLGAFLLTVSALWGILLAFQDHVVWGLLYLLVPIAGAIAFVIRNWKKRSVQTSFWFGLLGLLLVMSGSVLSLANGRSLVSQLVEARVPPLLPDATSEAVPTLTPDAQLQPPPVDSVSSTVPSQESLQTYHQTMSIGYAAYQQGDYQTALINFRRALAIQPGDRLATEAIQNTEAVIQQQ